MLIKNCRISVVRRNKSNRKIGKIRIKVLEGYKLYFLKNLKINGCKNDTWTWMMIWQCVEINQQLIWILNYLLYSKLKSQIRQALQDSTGGSESSQFYIAQLFKNKRLFTILNGTLSRETITPSLHFKTEEQKQNQLRSSRIIIVFSWLPYWKCSK